MQIHTRIRISCSDLHLWIILRRVEWFERWNPYVAIHREAFDPNTIRYYFTSDPRPGLCTMFTGMLAIDDPNMTLTIRFGTRKYFRLVETLRIERTSSQHWLHHDLGGEGLGVKLMRGLLARRIRPMMLHANAMLERFVTLSDAQALRQGDVVRVGYRSRRQKAESGIDRPKGDLPCPKF